MEGLYGATRETDSFFTTFGDFTSSSKLVPLQFIQYAHSIFPEAVPNLSLPVWQIECGKEGMTDVTCCEYEPWHSRKNLARNLCLVSNHVHDLNVAMMLMVGMEKIARHFSFVTVLR